MSVIKANPSENRVHRVMEGNGTSSKFDSSMRDASLHDSSMRDSSTFKYENFVKRMAETLAEKKRKQLACHKKPSRKTEDYPTPSVPPLPIQALQNKGMPKAFIALKDSPYTDINAKAVGQGKPLEIDGFELPINQYLSTENELPINAELTVERKLVTEDEIPLVSNIAANLVSIDVIPQIKNQPVIHHRTLLGDKAVVLNEGTALNTTKPPTTLSPSKSVKLTDFPTLKSQSEQAKVLPAVKKVEPKIALQPEIQSKKEINSSSQMREMNDNPLNEFRNTTISLEENMPLKADVPLKTNVPLKADELNNKPLGEQSIEVNFSDVQSEQPRAPTTPQKATHSFDNTRLELSETRTNPLANEEQKSPTLFQEVSTEKTDLESHIVASVINEMVVRPQTLSQTQQPSQMAHRTPEPMEPNSLFDAKESKAEARSLTYTFNNWKTKPSVTFELAPKGEFIALTGSQEVHQALNENKHLFNHESNVHIRREDERNQQHQQRHDQQQHQQEED